MICKQNLDPSFCLLYVEFSDVIILRAFTYGHLFKMLKKIIHKLYIIIEKKINPVYIDNKTFLFLSHEISKWNVYTKLWDWRVFLIVWMLSLWNKWKREKNRLKLHKFIQACLYFSWYTWTGIKTKIKLLYSKLEVV